MPEIEKYIPEKFDTYYEPFIGGGAVLFYLHPQKAIVNDINPELINLYNVIKEDVEGLISNLKSYINARYYFYEVRSWDRIDGVYNNLTPLQKATRTYYLNKTCYNGLYRVNRSGQFNTPYGRYSLDNIVDEKRLREASRYFNNADIKFLNTDFRNSIIGISINDFIYLDPPYVPLSITSSFISYAKGGFKIRSQEDLKYVCDQLSIHGIRFLMSNSSADYVYDLYKDYIIETVQAKRFINSKANCRGNIDEVLIRNYQ